MGVFKELFRKISETMLSRVNPLKLYRPPEEPVKRGLLSP